ncbi:MAG: 50S ribosomal protein L19 [Chitinispirillales bacterium]|jgi:large subunit ribosomal protein L19|nr:50S ribosomal protein L19 [Chitinispirillales bacterium]
MNEIIKAVEKKHLQNRSVEYGPGDTINVSFKIREGDKERIQQFQGVVVQTSGTGLGETLTVRKSSGNVYVERIFPAHSPLVAEIKVLKRGRVRRAKLFYLRGLTGKATRIKERKGK